MALPAQAPAPTWTGDHSVRPEVFSIIHNTASMQLEVALLESHGAVAWFDRDQTATTDEVATLIANKIRALTPDVVVYHYPEQFLVRFIHQHHAAIAASRREFPFGSNKLHLRA